MATLLANRAIEAAFQYGNALIKFISPNDAGVTNTHQCGFYLPKASWKMFTPHSPMKGSNNKHEVQIKWDDGCVTESVITWYGSGTRSEYRLTRFGKDFQYLNPDVVGSLLVLIPTSSNAFSAFVLDHDADIEELQAALGIEIHEGWGTYSSDSTEDQETESECLTRLFLEFTQSLTAFPSTKEFSEKTSAFVLECISGFDKFTSDKKLMTLRDIEYSLFKNVERHICEPLVMKAAKDIDQFLKLASSMLNRRKCRAGSSLEHHFERILSDHSIPFDSQCGEIRGKPDIVIPSAAAYLDSQYPRDKLFVVGVKTTCKDRWRQVLEEAPNVDKRYIMTLQPSVSAKQAAAMSSSRLSLIVPKSFHSTGYPEKSRGELKVYDVDSFVNHARETIA